jgi:hypothetical protein
MRYLATGLIPLALFAARLKADQYWGGPPPCGEPSMVTTSLTTEHFAEADLDNCRILVNDRFRWPWPALCTIAIHEAGHLHSLTHGSGRWVMSARYRGSVAACRSVSPWLATPRLESDWPE